MINLNRLGMFVAVVEAGSFTAAADTLGTTKAVVSFNLKQLEQELGVALLTRSTRRLALTEAGEGFYAECARLLREADAAVDQARSGQATLAGSLRVTATVDYGNRIVAPALAAFARRHPALRVSYQASSAHADLIGDRLDLAIRVGTLADSSYRATPIGQFKLLLVASSALLAEHGAPRTLEALAAMPWLANRPGRSDHWRVTDGKGREHALRVAPVAHADTASALLAFAEAGCGVAALPDWLLEEPLARGVLQRVLPTISLPPQPVYAVYPDTRHVSAKVRRFIDFLRAPDKP
ncbi:LysR family transcriptional regulator [Achromobacter marplatensis]|uniref:LysR family transcriptional regulator n=1 Tax=Achromobacter marplatensis TaxID=470868 RepID=UPI000277F8D9|nr:LysR family transcriptional regulator [Achromobacter marplatensis]EJO31572.1 LysR family transcriptional regulator [Achromobacter marplatensis]